MTDLLVVNFGEASPPAEQTCKGLFFRVRESAYISSAGSIVSKREYYPLKRLSCTGCSRCAYLMEDMQERGYSFIDGGKPGDIVELVVTNICRDWETGYIDDWDLEFVKRDIK